MLAPSPDLESGFLFPERAGSMYQRLAAYRDDHWSKPCHA
jgi:hypothetical protein